MATAVPSILVTGYTGFVGKVVVEELMRRSFAGQIPEHRLTVLIRSKKGLSIQERFEKSTQAICFAELDKSWKNSVELVDGDLVEKNLGLEPAKYDELAGHVTHIIHCAAAVAFDSPLKEAAAANIQTAQNVLEFARSCQTLARFIHTSTAYVNPHREGLIREELAPLPRGDSAEELYRQICNDEIDEADVLRTSGHANTYTLTKNISERLLSERRGFVPLTIVRPSMITAAMTYPFPGFIDSYSAVGGCTALFGLGFLKVIEANPSIETDTIPVDFVANQLIDAANLQNYGRADSPMLEQNISLATASFEVQHCVAGRGCRRSVEQWKAITGDFFSTLPGGRPVSWAYMGPRCAAFYWHTLLAQMLPMLIGRLWLFVTRQQAQAKKLRTVGRSIAKMNDVFPYFWANEWDFEVSRPLPADFDAEDYVRLFCAGVHRHLIGRELTIQDMVAKRSAGATAKKGGAAATGKEACAALWSRLSSWHIVLLHCTAFLAWSLWSMVIEVGLFG